MITGATSFIGEHLIKELKKDGWSIIAVIRREAPLKEYLSDVSVVRLDMDEYDTTTALPSCDCLVHLAWNGTRGDTRNDAVMQNENLRHSIAVVCKALHNGCGRVVLAGSQAEYGVWDEVLDETHECRPNTEYGRKKLRLYEWAKEECAAYGVTLIEPRFFSLYGKGDYPGTMVISTIKKMQEGKPCNFTKAEQMWNYLYIDDAARALAKLIAAEDADGIYNFGSRDTRTLRSYIEEMASVLGSKSELNFGAVPYPDIGPVAIQPSVDKLYNLLNEEPNISFAEGVRMIAGQPTKSETR